MSQTRRGGGLSSDTARRPREISAEEEQVRWDSIDWSDDGKEDNGAMSYTESSNQ